MSGLTDTEVVNLRDLKALSDTTVTPEVHSSKQA
jgi:hypothetical protein